MDPQTGGPVPGRAGPGRAGPGREILWEFVSEFIVQRLVRETRWEQAVALQVQRIDHEHRSLTVLSQDPVDFDALPSFHSLSRVLGRDRPPDLLRIMREDAYRGLGVSYSDLGDAFAGMGDERCLAAYAAALRIFEALGDTASSAKTWHQMANVHQFVPGLIDLDKAWALAQRSLRARPSRDRHGRALNHGQLANIRFAQAKELPVGNEATAALLVEAQEGYERALALMPAVGLRSRGSAHNNLGSVLMMRGELEEGRRQLLQAVEEYEAVGDLDRASDARVNLAAALLPFLRFTESREYARAALAYFSAAHDEAQVIRCTFVLQGIDMLEGAAGQRDPDRPGR
ncbi:hypothetical protein ACEZDB_10090 [Streptacidiphilus sp. N1-3]|uniref:Tetratricopeptide repeat protein n=1 Tax=Streptacidiphilus alkalitolerans TaxID=3342712 RepID=A0ABV6WY89_9ACTN